MSPWTADTPKVGALVAPGLGTLYGPVYFVKHLRTELPFASPSSGHFLLSYQEWKEKIVLFSLKATQGNARSMMKLHSVSFNSFLSPLVCSLWCPWQTESSIFHVLITSPLLTQSPHYNHLKRCHLHTVGAHAFIQLPLERTYLVERLRLKVSKEQSCSDYFLVSRRPHFYVSALLIHLETVLKDCLLSVKPGSHLSTGQQHSIPSKAVLSGWVTLLSFEDVMVIDGP